MADKPHTKTISVRNKGKGVIHEVSAVYVDASNISEGAVTMGMFGEIQEGKEVEYNLDKFHIVAAMESFSLKWVNDSGETVQTPAQQAKPGWIYSSAKMAVSADGAEIEFAFSEVPAYG